MRSVLSNYHRSQLQSLINLAARCDVEKFLSLSRIQLARECQQENQSIYQKPLKLISSFQNLRLKGALLVGLDTNALV